MATIPHEVERAFLELVKTNRPAFDYAGDDPNFVPGHIQSARRTFLFYVAVLYPDVMVTLVENCRPYYPRLLEDPGIGVSAIKMYPSEFGRVNTEHAELMQVIAEWQQAAHLLSASDEDHWIAEFALQVALVDAHHWNKSAEAAPMLAILNIVLSERRRATDRPSVSYLWDLLSPEVPQPFTPDPRGFMESEADHKKRVSQRQREHLNSYYQKQKQWAKALGLAPPPSRIKQFDHHEALAHYQVGNMGYESVYEILPYMSVRSREAVRTVGDACISTARHIGLRLTKKKTGPRSSPS